MSLLKLQRPRHRRKPPPRRRVRPRRPATVASQGDASCDGWLNSCPTPPIPRGERGRGQRPRSAVDDLAGLGGEPMKMQRSLIIVLIAIACTLLFATPALASTPLNSYEKQVATLVNKQRARFGLPQLRAPRQADRGRARPLDGHGPAAELEHNSPSGETWSSRIVRCGYTRKGYSYWKAGENIYYGSGLYSSPFVVVKAWMKSRHTGRSSSPGSSATWVWARSRPGRLRQHRRPRVDLHARRRAPDRTVARRRQIERVERAGARERPSCVEGRVARSTMTAWTSTPA